MSTHQFANIAPAPQGNNTMQSGQSQGGPTGPQVMSPSGQPMQQMPMGQFQIIQSQMGTPNQQYAIPQIATYNQQGQYVLQPANYAFQQPGGQQFILTAAPTQMTQQKPGQQMLGTPQQQSQAGKTMVPMTMSQGGSYTISSGMVSGAANGGQTFMIANPMGGAPIMATHQTGMGPGQMGGQMKQDNSKQGQNQQSQVQAQQATIASQQQSILMPQGMAFMAPQGQTAQAIFHNGQIILRAPMQDGSQSQFMFSSPPTHPLPQQPTMQPNPTQQLPPGMTTNMQPMSMQAANSQMRPPVSLPSQPPPGKTPISRSLAPILPTTSTSTSTMRQTNYPGMPTLSANPPSSSPKSKQKMSPRGNSGHGGRPSGPKSAVNALKQPPNTSMSPPCLSNSPQFSQQPGSPMSLGPPVLQTSMPLAPLPRSSPHSQPPTLQPMMLPSVPPTSSNDPTRYMGKPFDSHPPTLSANAPMPPLDNSKKFDMSNKVNQNRKPDDKYNNGDMDHHQSNGNNDNSSTHVSHTPKAVVKPNVLTHVIDGHIIQESSQPFPLDHSDSKDRANSQYDDSEEMDSQNGNQPSPMEYVRTNTPVDQAPPTPQQPTQIQQQQQSTNPTTTTTNSTTTTTTPTTPNLVSRPTPPIKPTQLTQPVVLESKNKLNSKSVDAMSGSEKKRGPGRPPGSKNQNVEQQKVQQISHSNGDLKGKGMDAPPSKKSKLDISDNLKISTGHSPSGKPCSKSPTLNIDMTTNNPLKWTVTQVCDFVKSLPGCSDYVEDFQIQEIDGQALMLLKADHLMSAMAIKLGPALKICSAIDAMREELKQN